LVFWFCRWLLFLPLASFLRWHPRGAFAAQALPLCGAAVTFFAAAKKVTKESGFLTSGARKDNAAALVL
jgi:hypothetical protein